MEKLRLRIKELNEHLQANKESDTYKTINIIDNREEYFNSTRQQLHWVVLKISYVIF